MAQALPTYAVRSRWTAHALWFLLLPILSYEAWAVFIAPQSHAPTLLAHSLISEFFHRVGNFNWAFMPGLFAIIALLAIHLAENIRQENRHQLWVAPDPFLYAVMLLESLAWAVPLLVIGAVINLRFGQQAALAPSLAAAAEPLAARGHLAAHDPWGIWRQGAMLSLGAGIFEELVFRLFGLNLFTLITSALFGKDHPLGIAVAMASTALLFAAAHFVSRDNVFDWGKGVFYFFGGVYFAVIYLWRGFGIAAATHILFDIMVTTIALRQDLA